MKILQHPSPKAERLLSEAGLGQAKAEYTDQMLQAGLLAFIFLPLGLLFVALVFPSLLAPSYPTSENWFERWGNLLPTLMWGSCFFLMGLLCIVLLAVALFRGQQRVYLGEKGFLSAHRRLDMVARWEEIQEIRRRLLFSKGKTNNVQRVTFASTYTIVSTEGKTCSIASDPGPAIEQAVTASQLPQALENYGAGKMLSFGWLELNHEGFHLHPEAFAEKRSTTPTKRAGGIIPSPKLLGTCIESGEHSLPWEHLACYWIDESRSTLVLSKKGVRKHWAIVPLYQVPNSALCLALIEHALSNTIHEIA